MIAHPRSALSPSPRLQRRGRFMRFFWFFLRTVVLAVRSHPVLFRTSSLVVFQRTPLRRHSPLASGPDLPEGLSSAECCQTLDAFRPCRSSRLRRLAPRTALQVCCTLQPAMGFEPFPVRPPADCVSTTVGPPRLSQARSSHPSKPFPPWKPHRVTATVAIPPSACSSFPNHSPRPHGLTPPENPLLVDTVSRLAQPDAPLGLVPLQGAPLDTAAHWTAPERHRRSGSALGHVHRSGRALNVASAEAAAWQAEACPSLCSARARRYRPRCLRRERLRHRPADSKSACH